MNAPSAPDGSSYGDGRHESSVRRSFWWWLRAAEVRLRFILLTGLTLLVATQWGRLQAWSQTVLHAWRGDATAHAVSGNTEFFCPMDPGVVSDWPAICPICNMDLVPRKKSDAQLLPEGVVARMQLTPYRIQLAGIRTSEVVAMPLQQRIEAVGVLSETELGTLSFDAPLCRDDAALLESPRDAEVVSVEDPANSASATAELVPFDGNDAVRTPKVRVTLLDAGHSLVEGQHVRAIVRVPVAATDLADDATESPSAPENPGEHHGSDAHVSGEILSIPESAVVDHGYQQLVFVESMPGMFDAVVVQLGSRCGDYYPVIEGLEAGERVVVNGAFLIDAETRLNPSLAVQYFGANQASSERVPQLRAAGAPTELSPEDALLAERQEICPVTMKPLDSMGGPVLVMVEGRKVFICCRGCENALTSEPAKYLERLPSDD